MIAPFYYCPILDFVVSDPSLSKDENDTHLKLLYSWPPGQATDALLNICGFGESVAAYSAQWGRYPAHTVTLGEYRYSVLSLTELLRAVVVTPAAARAGDAVRAVQMMRDSAATLPQVWSPQAPAVGALTGPQLISAVAGITDLVRAIHGGFDVFRRPEDCAGVGRLLEAVSRNGLPASLVDLTAPLSLTPPPVLLRLGAALHTLTTAFVRRTAQGRDAAVGRWALFGKTAWAGASEAAGVFRCVASCFLPADTAYLDALLSLCPPRGKSAQLQPDKPLWTPEFDGPTTASPAHSFWLLDREQAPLSGAAAARGAWPSRRPVRLLMIKSAQLVFFIELSSVGPCDETSVAVREIQTAVELTAALQTLVSDLSGEPVPLDAAPPAALPPPLVVKFNEMVGFGQPAPLPLLYSELAPVSGRTVDAVVRFTGGVRFSLPPPAVGSRGGVLRPDAPLVLYHRLMDVARRLDADERFILRVWAAGRAATISKVPYGFVSGACGADTRNSTAAFQAAHDLFFQLRDFFV